MPVEWSPAKRRQKDVEARWTEKHGQSYFGYKLSVSVVPRHKLIGWRPHIQRKGKAGKPFGERDKAWNKRIASPRARVEHVFASFAQMGGKMVRSIGLARGSLVWWSNRQSTTSSGCRACWKWHELGRRSLTATGDAGCPASP